MATEMEAALESEFGMFGIDIAGNIAVLEKLIDICNKFELTSDSVVAKWFTYNNKSGQVITPDILDEFEKMLTVGNKKALMSKKKGTPHSSSSYNASTINQKIGDMNDDEDVIDSYATTPKVKESIKRLHTTPDEPAFNKRVASLSGTPQRHFSPASMSPLGMTPSLKYESRTGKGDIVCSYGVADNTSVQWKGCYEGVTIKPFPETNVQTPYRYMFQKLQDKALVLDEMINALSHQMRDTLMLDEFENVSAQSQDDVTIAGRICCDSVGRLNSKSVLLEGSIETSGGERVPLDLTDVNNYSLFPGQIVAMQGKNVSGFKVHPSSIYPGTRLPFYSAAKKDLQINENHVTVYVSCGPYATNDTEVLAYTPLDNLLETVQCEVPDVVVMMGPFVDAKHPLILSGKIDYSYDELFQIICDKVTAAVKNLKTEVVFVPSQRDVCHECVYPQPPFAGELNKRIKMMSDPSTILINDICIGMTSTDILFHLGGEEVSAFTVKSDRLGRIADHLLRQQCYYPLHPPSSEVNIDMEQFENFAFMPVTPDVLIVPSDLRYFIKDLDGCLAINPGRLVKGKTGGTFLKLLLKPKKCENANRSSVVDESIGQVVRI